jgi:hypothetical protein
MGMSMFLLVTMYTSMSLAALGVELIFRALRLVPARHHTNIIEASITFNYTTVLNLVFLAVALLLILRFLKTGGPEMLRMMNAPEHSTDRGGHTFSSHRSKRASG